MKTALLLELLHCQRCGCRFVAHPLRSEGAEILEGELACSGCERKVPIRRGVPRFVEADAYADAFSFEWNVHRITQLDSVNGRSDSEERFTHTIGLPPNEWAGKMFLDIGVGTGRFAEVALKHGGTVIGIDLSLAVDAAFTNVGRHPRMHILQADLFDLPLDAAIFDVVYSLGVLHHTPNCRQAFEQLPKYAKAGGTIAITVYTGSNKHYVAATNFWRHLTTRLPKKVLYALSHMAVPLYYLYRIPGLRQIGMGICPINMDPDWRWRVLDTFDCYSPTYQSFHTYPEVFSWFEAAGCERIRIIEPAVTVLGMRPDTGAMRNA